MIYPGITLLLAAAYGALVRNRWYYASSLLILLGWTAVLGSRGYRSARMSIAGLDQIAAGMACLLAGLLVSLWKLGVPQGWIDRWLKPPPGPVATVGDIDSIDRGSGIN